MNQVCWSREISKTCRTAALEDRLSTSPDNQNVEVTTTKVTSGLAAVTLKPLTGEVNNDDDDIFCWVLASMLMLNDKC